MNNTLEQFQRGRRVRFIPWLAKQSPKECEDGVVKRCSDNFVFVNFDNDDKKVDVACWPEDLIILK